MTVLLLLIDGCRVVTDTHGVILFPFQRNASDQIPDVLVDWSGDKGISVDKLMIMTPFADIIKLD